MKKTIIGALVGGLIIFLCQFLSYALLNLHKPAQQYTEKQETILNFLKDQQLVEGGYIVPNLPETASSEDMENYMKNVSGKPWASIQYHQAMDTNMTMNMVRGFITNIVIILLFCWLIYRMNAPGFSTILLSALVVGVIVFLNQPYTNFIWYKNFDIWASFADALIGWGLAGLWLAWWLSRDNRVAVRVKHKEKEPELV